jgi:hypothetical protein
VEMVRMAEMNIVTGLHGDKTGADDLEERQ